MEIAIKCQCGNKAIVPGLHNKKTMLRDYLDKKDFSVEAKSGEVKIFCKKCKSLVIVSFE